MIYYPRITADVEDMKYGLDLMLPEEYREWIKKIDDNVKIGTQKKCNLIQAKCNLDTSNGTFPGLEWSSNERGLLRIVIGMHCPCAKLDEEGRRFFFHNVSTSVQSLALLSMLTAYLNGLQLYKQK